MLTVGSAELDALSLPHLLTVCAADKELEAEELEEKEAFLLGKLDLEGFALGDAQ